MWEKPIKQDVVKNQNSQMITVVNYVKSTLRNGFIKNTNRVTKTLSKNKIWKDLSLRRGTVLLKE